MKLGRCMVLSVFFLISLVFVFRAFAGFEIHPCYVFNDMYGTAGTRLDATVSSGCLICHMVESNPYGSDIYDYLRECFETSICDEATIEGAIRNVEPFDSDGDGYNNITEINNLTFPNDPNDHPVYVAQWAKTYGGSNYDHASSVQQTSDGGFIVGGSTVSFGAGGYDFWVLKLDASGNVLWQKAYGGNGSDGGSIQQTSDGGYIVAGGTYSFGAGSADAWVLKLDGNGNVQWQKTYGSSDEEHAYSIKQTSDGGYIVAGEIYYVSAGGYDIWVLKLDTNGNVVWQKTYGGSYPLIGDAAHSVQQTSDDGYIVAGYTFSFGAGGCDFWVLKLDANGNVSWQKTYGGSYYDVARSVQQTPDGGYIVAGTTESFGADSVDAWVLKLDTNGNVVWQKAYGGSYENEARSVQQTSDGGYIVAGRRESAGPSNFWVLKLDTNGNVVWQKIYGGSNSDDSGPIQQTSDGGYLVAGTTYSFGAGYWDAFVLKLDSYGDISDCPIIETPDAVVNNTNATVKDTTVTVLDTTISPQTSTASVTDTNTTMTDACYYPLPTIGYSPTSFSFTATQGGINPPYQTLSITNTGNGILSWSASDDATWLSLNPTSGTDSGTVTVSVNIAGLTAGTYNATITVSATGATNSPVSILVTLTVNAPPFIIIFSPNGGEIIPSGSTYTISWGAPPDAVKFDIGYSLDNGVPGTWKLIASNVTDHNYNWTVPSPDGNKNTCRVGVRGYNASDGVVGTDTSDNPFKIEVIKLTDPDGGETLTSGNTYRITWQTNSTIRTVQTVKIYGSPNEGQSGTWRVLTTVSGNPGYYDWTIPQVGTAKDKCRLGLRLLDSNSIPIGQDVGDGNFTIQPAP